MQNIKAVWKPLSAEDGARLARISRPLRLDRRRLAGFDPSTREEAGAIVLYSFLCGVIDSQVRAAVRESEDKRAYLANYRRGQSPLAELWWNSLLTVSRTFPFRDG